MNWEVYKQDYIENVLRSNYDIKNNLGRNWAKSEIKVI
jgi:hypothetical protein